MSFRLFETVDEISRQEEMLKTIKGLTTYSPEHEAKLRFLEKEIITNNYNLIVKTARLVGEQLISSPQMPAPRSIEEAYQQRYIYVPILYKLGYPKEAAELDQTTFAFLFPTLHQMILNKLHSLFGEDLKAVEVKILKHFTMQNDKVSDISARMKSTNSIWKKISNIEELNLMSHADFAKAVDDFIGLTYSIKMNENENRYDALMNGVQLAPKQHAVRFRNQQVTQSSGFSAEPLIKIYYLIQNVPVELQLHGGNLRHFLDAKGYASYKSKINFTPANVNNEARLGICLFYCENNLQLQFRQLMLKELRGEEIDYGEEHLFVLDKEPNEENKLLCFTEHTTPIYLLANCEFENEINIITHTSFTNKFQ